MDTDGIFQGHPEDPKDPWGICGPDCPTDEETKTWSKDDTVKVTLHYYNPALWVGLQVYGSILLWIFVLGLILTTLMPLLGKVIVLSI